jgi:2-polyprenyl-6-hydroxyphenyl methylase / 3-demethylubiquinone-9 3-methyltransferase
MPIDNAVYNREGEGWWEEDNPLNILHGGLTPGRFAYFREILTDRLCTDLPDLRALGIGCGGGWRTADAAKPCMISVGAEISEDQSPTADEQGSSLFNLLLFGNHFDLAPFLLSGDLADQFVT